ADEYSGTCCTGETNKACCESSQNRHNAGVWASSTNTCCHSDDTSEACCKARKGSNAKYCNGKCYPNASDSADACKCHSGNSAYLVGTTCCTAEIDSKKCCESHKGGNHDDFGTWCPSSSTKCVHDDDEDNDKEACLCLRPKGWWSSSQSYCCNNENSKGCCESETRSPYHTQGTYAAVTETKINRITGQAYEDVVTSYCCHSDNSSEACCKALKGSSAYLVGSTCCSDPQSSKACCNAYINSYNDSRGVWVQANTSGTSYRCVWEDDEDDDQWACEGLRPKGWWSGSGCCTGEYGKNCCEAETKSPYHIQGVFAVYSKNDGTLQPIEDANKTNKNNRVCCHSQTQSDICCKAMNGYSATPFLTGDTCCLTGQSSQQCCEASINSYNDSRGVWVQANASGTSYRCVYDDDEDDDQWACAGLRPNGWWSGSGCCTVEQGQFCCEASTNPKGKGVWVQVYSCSTNRLGVTTCSPDYDYGATVNTCCHSQIESDVCCKGYKHSETAFLAGTTCCSSKNDSQACCNAGCDTGSGTYSNGTCTCTEQCSDGWLVGTTCCHYDSTKACCEASNNPNGKGTYVNGRCCHGSGGASQECCQARNDSSFWWDGINTCCEDEGDKSTCCTSTYTASPNHQSSGTWVSSSNTCCHNKNSSATCCKALCNNGDNYTYSNGTCTCSACPNGWLVGSTCCTGDVDSTCCQANNNPAGKGVWKDSTCCHSDTSSDLCCKARNDNTFWLDKTETICCEDETDSPSGSCCTSAYTSTSNHTPNGTWVKSGTYGAKYDTCCHSATYSDTCCKAMKGSDYSLSGSECSIPEDPEFTVQPQVTYVTITTSMGMDYAYLINPATFDIDNEPYYTPKQLQLENGSTLNIEQVYFGDLGYYNYAKYIEQQDCNWKRDCEIFARNAVPYWEYSNPYFKFRDKNMGFWYNSCSDPKYSTTVTSLNGGGLDVSNVNTNTVTLKGSCYGTQACRCTLKAYLFVGFQDNFDDWAQSAYQYCGGLILPYDKGDGADDDYGHGVSEYMIDLGKMSDDNYQIYYYSDSIPMGHGYYVRGIYNTTISNVVDRIAACTKKMLPGQFFSTQIDEAARLTKNTVTSTTNGISRQICSDYGGGTTTCIDLYKLIKVFLKNLEDKTNSWPAEWEAADEPYGPTGSY
ncbi:hypothetical protein IJ818_01770, partial [bacterium]|nr:hypothetical protein [bacterium]